MMTLVRLALLLVLALGPGLITTSQPALAEHNDGLDNDGDGEVDEPDEHTGGGDDFGRLEAVCNATAQIDACLASHNMFCQYFSLPLSCALAEIGNNCNGGDPNQCRYYEGLMQANVACSVQGDQSACAWLHQQPVIYSHR